MTPHIGRVALVLLAASVLVSVGSVGALAQGQASDTNDEVRIIDEEITIRDGLVRISDTTLQGPGLPDTHIEQRKVVLESTTVRFDGFHITAFDTDMTFCRIVVHVEDVGLLVEDVTLKNR